MAGGIHRAGGNRIDARIHTTRDGLALDNFLVQDPLGRPFAEAGQIVRLTRAIEDALANRQKLLPKLEARALPRTRAEAFRVAPNVFVDNKASNRFTVIEVNRSEEHTSELQSLMRISYAVFCLKKKTQTTTENNNN